MEASLNNDIINDEQPSESLLIVNSNTREMEEQE